MNAKTKPLKLQKPAAKAVKTNASAALAERLSKTPKATTTTTRSANKAAAQSAATSKRPAAKASLAPPRPAIGASKQSQLIARLHSGPGASIAEMMILTGWQAHTVRGVISGVLRKGLGLNVTCDARRADGKHLYRIQGTVA